MTEINRKVVKRDRVDTGQFFRIFIIYTPKIALYEKKYKKNTISQKKYLQSHRPWFILNIAVA